MNRWQAGALGFAVGAALVFVALAGAGVIWWIAVHRSCTVGYAGTDVQVTAQGFQSRADCDGLIANSSNSGYLTDPDPTGTLMCLYGLNDGVTVSVRDKGALKLYGSAKCEELRLIARGT